MKADLSQITVSTYDRSASQFADHFQSYVDGAARAEIDRTLGFLEDPGTTRVVEVGCGAGKDAADIITKVGEYEGFDPSAKLLEVAREHVPGASFTVADALSFEYSPGLGAVFAFASLLHLDRDDFAKACKKIYTALKPGGVVCMTLKEASDYTEILQEDKFGQRQFYLYNPALVCELAGSGFSMIHEAHHVVGPEQKQWFTIILQKV